MRRVLGWALFLASCESAAAPAPASPQPTAAPPAIAGRLALEPVAKRLSQPLYLTAPAGDRARLFIVEKTGRIRILRGGALLAEPFLDLADQVSGSSEQGLLGLAFHPRYAENRRFFVNYTDRRGDTRVVEYRALEATPDRADPASARELLMIDQPYANHNGGHVAFGPDGALYVGTGDGGSANDPHGNGQNQRTLLGKMLRLDVDAAEPRAEIVAIGLRNPWRYDFDPRTGDLYIGDVGQDRWEEVDVVPFASLRGANFGWNVVEGLGHCLRGSSCAQAGMVQPVVDYDHRAGCSVTGGEVYRGEALPELDGMYLFADYCTGLLRGLRWKDGKVTDYWDLKPALDPKNRLAQVTSFGEDADGEVYVLLQEGTVYKLVRH